MEFWRFFKSLQTNCNKFEQKNWIIKPWFKTKNNFIGRLEEDNGATMFFIIEKSEETTFNFHKIL